MSMPGGGFDPLDGLELYWDPRPDFCAGCAVAIGAGDLVRREGFLCYCSGCAADLAAGRPLRAWSRQEGISWD